MSKLTKDLNCCVSFYPDFCLFQDLFSGKVKGIERLENDLYVLKFDCSLQNQGYSNLPVDMTKSCIVEVPSSTLTLSLSLYLA